MKKLKKQKLHAIYITIFTVMVCALMWTDIEWRRVVSTALLPFSVTAFLFDARYDSLFE